MVPPPTETTFLKDLDTWVLRTQNLGGFDFLIETMSVATPEWLKLCREVSRLGNLPMLSRLIRRDNHALSSDMIAVLVEHDHAHCLQWLIENGLLDPFAPTISWMINEMLLYGSIKCVKLYHQLGWRFDNTLYACIAAYYNQSQCLQYLVSIGAPVPRSLSVANLFLRRRIHWRTVITAMRCGFPLI